MGRSVMSIWTTRVLSIYSPVRVKYEAAKMVVVDQ
jgi:hypothetical protein